MTARAPLRDDDYIFRAGPAPKRRRARSVEVQLPLPPPVPAGALFVRVAIKTRNPNNGATGNSRLAGIIKSRQRKTERTKTRDGIALHFHQEQVRRHETEDRFVPVRCWACYGSGRKNVMHPCGEVHSRVMCIKCMGTGSVFGKGPWRVTVTRVAPSSGLDPHDGLGAALKGCIDGIADALGLRNDRDPRVTWVLGQRRCSRKEGYSVEIQIEARAA